jgi:hypothetical protein
MASLLGLTEKGMETFAEAKKTSRRVIAHRVLVVAMASH